jgi:hypothetical protein
MYRATISGILWTNCVLLAVCVDKGEVWGYCGTFREHLSFISSVVGHDSRALRRAWLRFPLEFVMSEIAHALPA